MAIAIIQLPSRSRYIRINKNNNDNNNNNSIKCTWDVLLVIKSFIFKTYK